MREVLIESAQAGRSRGAADAPGGGRAAVTFSAAVSVARPAEEVFAFLMECENNLLWQSGLEDVWQITAGEVGLGTRVCEVRRFLGRRVSSEFEVVTYEPPRRCTTRAVRAPVPFEATYTVGAAGRGAVITATGCVPHRALPRLVARATGVLAQQEIEASLHRLKGVLEQASVPARAPRPVAATGPR